jgi:hypothetical protein
MDQLHFDLWWRGMNLVVDAGTFAYNSPPSWDNPLVSARVHNTVTIDGYDQMTRGGRFMVLDWFPAYARRALTGGTTSLGQLIAHHRGFERLGIRYERTVTLLEPRRWQVRDDFHFLKPGLHTIRLHWLLRDGEWRLQQRGPRTSLSLRIPGGWLRLQIVAEGMRDAALRPLLIRAGKVLRGQGRAEPFEGWISPTYGRKLPALSLALEATASASCSYTTEFVLPA